MKIIYDKDGEKKGKLKSLQEIENTYQKAFLEPFVRNGCFIFEYKKGKYGAIPGRFATIKEVEE